MNDSLHLVTYKYALEKLLFSIIFKEALTSETTTEVV